MGRQSLSTVDNSGEKQRVSKPREDVHSLVMSEWLLLEATFLHKKAVAMIMTGLMNKKYGSITVHSIQEPCNCLT